MHCTEKDRREVGKRREEGRGCAREERKKRERVGAGSEGLLT